MNKEEFEKLILEENKVLYLESERKYFFNYENKIFVFQEDENGNGKTLGNQDPNNEVDYENLKISSRKFF